MVHNLIGVVVCCDNSASSGCNETLTVQFGNWELFQLIFGKIRLLDFLTICTDYLP